MSATPKQFEDRSALVTGGASGIGAATAALLGRRGARVCVADVDVDGAKAVAETIVAAGGDAFALAMDVTDEAAVDAGVAAIEERWGGLYLAHLNAGVTSYTPLLQLDATEWDRIVGINLRGAFLTLRAAARAMKRAGGGAAVVTSSVAGIAGAANSAAYTASKHGVVGLVRASAAELAVQGIRVNALIPGGVDTPILGPLHNDPAAQAGLGALHPIGRVGRPEELAEVVRFLLSDEASFVVGAAVAADGGFSAVLPPGGSGGEMLASMEDG